MELCIIPIRRPGKGSREKKREKICLKNEMWSYIGELLARFLAAPEPSIDHVHAVGLRVVQMTLHEAAEPA